MRATIMVVRFSLVRLKTSAARDAPAAWPASCLRERLSLGKLLRFGLRQLRKTFHGLVVARPQPFPNRQPSVKRHHLHACIYPGRSQNQTRPAPSKHANTMPTTASNVLLVLLFVGERFLGGPRGKIGSQTRLLTGRADAITLWRW